MEILGIIFEYGVESPGMEVQSEPPYEKRLIQILQQSKEQEEADNLLLFEYYEKLFKNNPRLLLSLFVQHLLDDGIRAGKDYYKLSGRRHAYQEFGVYGITDNGEPIFYDLLPW